MSIPNSSVMTPGAFTTADLGSALLAVVVEIDEANPGYDLPEDS